MEHQFGNHIVHWDPPLGDPMHFAARISLVPFRFSPPRSASEHERVVKESSREHTHKKKLDAVCPTMQPPPSNNSSSSGINNKSRGSISTSSRRRALRLLTTTAATLTIASLVG
ncbi:hypothetical protein VYU27_009099, partial [Nannochloropsis oceanica]